MSRDTRKRLFKEVRGEALEALYQGTHRQDELLMCEWQNRHVSHVGVYCNALSHMDSVADLLAHGAWCDELTVPLTFVDDHDADRLFRFYSLVMLMLSECLTDLRNIAQAVDRRARLEPQAHELMGYINSVWKHRNTDQGEQQSFHGHHHHGPYLFADGGQDVSALAPDGRYVALGHVPSRGTGPAPLVVPSLTSAVRAVGDQVHALSDVLEVAEARAKVESAWKTADIPTD